MVDPSYLDAIKQFEGYSGEARWDYAQNSNGYGTRAKYAGEVIDKAEADRRFSGEVQKAADFVDKFAPGLDDGSKAALTSLTYNTGTAWTQSGLGQAVSSGDLDKAKSLFLQYNKAGGAVVDGLVQRRLQEVAWFGQGLGAGSPTAQVASASLAAMASAASGTSSSSGSVSQAVPAPLFSNVGRSSTASQASSDSSGAKPFLSFNSDRVLLALLPRMANVGVTNDDKDAKKPEHRTDQKSPEPNIQLRSG